MDVERQSHTDAVADGITANGSYQDQMDEDYVVQAEGAIAFPFVAILTVW